MSHRSRFTILKGILLTALIGAASVAMPGLASGQARGSLQVTATVVQTQGAVAGGSGALHSDSSLLSVNRGCSCRSIMRRSFRTASPTFAPGVPVTYTIATVNGLGGSIRTNNGAFDPAGFTFSSSTIQAMNYSLAVAGGTNLQLTFTPVPEPGLTLLTGLAGLAAGCRLRRRGLASLRRYFRRT